MHPLRRGFFVQSDGHRHLLVHGKAAKTDARGRNRVLLPGLL